MMARRKTGCGSPFLVRPRLSLRAAFVVVLLWGHAPASGRQFQTSFAEITATGLTRPGELLADMQRLRTTSLDGYTMRLSLDGRSGLFDPGPLIYIDGVPQYYYAFGFNQPAALPVSVADIESTLLSRKPDQSTILNSNGGRIDIQTRRPTGYAVNASFFARNETRDPGPYSYTDHPAQNIDRSGPRLNASASWGGKAWFVRISGATDEHHVTDERIRSRVRSLYDGVESAKVKLNRADILVERTTSNGLHQLHVGRTEFRDFLFIRPESVEVPLKQTWSYVTAHGRESLVPDLSLEYTVDRRWTKTTARPTILPFGPPIENEMTNARLTLRKRLGSTELGIETGVTLRSIQAGPLDSRTTRSNRAGVRLSATMAEPGTQHVVSVLIKRPFGEGISENPAEVGVMWDAAWTVTPGVNMDFLAAYTRVPQPEPLSTEEAFVRGDPRPVFGAIISDDQHLPSATRMETQLSAGVALRPSVHVRGRGMYRHWKDLSTFVDARAAPNPPSPAPSQTVPPVASTGHVAGVGIELIWRANEGHLVRAEYDWMSTVFHHTPLFRAYLSGLLGHQASVTGLYSMTKRFRIRARLAWTPLRRWPGNDPGIKTERTSRLSADITFQKDLLMDYLEVSLGLRNLGRPVRMHPDGASDALALQITLRLRIRNDEARP